MRNPLATPELGLQRCDPGLQRLVFLARQAGHVLDRLELLALDHVEVAQNALGLSAHHGVELALGALRGTAASFIRRPISSKKRLVVWVIRMLRLAPWA